MTIAKDFSMKVLGNDVEGFLQGSNRGNRSLVNFDGTVGKLREREARINVGPEFCKGMPA
jgi:hypothetical protein